jgi:phosphatidylglycerol---prolipoprotein diacylglyceryl transferase
MKRRTGLAWAVDLGGGIGRHPVQLYDIIDDGSVPDPGRFGEGTHLSHTDCRLMLLQRFAWQFLKPYPTLVGQFNIFHW